MGLGGLAVVVGAAVLALSGPVVAQRRGWNTTTVFWTLGSLVFLVLALLLAYMGLDALSLKAAPLVGSLYPVFLAASVLSAGTRYWRHYFAFAVAMLLLIAAGSVLGLGPLRGAAHGLLHGVSGVILAFGPVYYGVRGLAVNGWVYLVGLGGLTISAGGLGLALASVGVEVVAGIVLKLLYPVLALSALLMALGFVASDGLAVRAR